MVKVRINIEYNFAVEDMHLRKDLMGFIEGSTTLDDARKINAEIRNYFCHSGLFELPIVPKVGDWIDLEDFCFEEFPEPPEYPRIADPEDYIKIPESISEGCGAYHVEKLSEIAKSWIDGQGSVREITSVHICKGHLTIEIQ